MAAGNVCIGHKVSRSPNVTECHQFTTETPIVAQHAARPALLKYESVGVVLGDREYS